MQVKICGIKDIEAAKASIENGADYLGFNFIKASKRLISPDDSQYIVNKVRNMYPKKKFKCVGLFDKELFSDAENIVEFSKLDMIQLCGEGDIDTSIPSIKQIRVKPEDSEDKIIKKIQQYLMIHNYVILDTYKEGKLGGTGEKFDWNSLKNIISTTNVFTSGGLDEDNIPNLIKNFKPFAIDVSSGVETEGKKDPIKIKSFLKKARIN